MTRTKSSFLSLKDAQTLAKKLKITSAKEWRKYWEKQVKPDNIPIEISEFYNISPQNFFGNDYLKNTKREFMSFRESKIFVRELGIKKQIEWRKYDKANFPKNMPRDPPKVYKKEWKGWGDWLGTGTIATQNKKFRTFEDVREYAQSLNLKSSLEWEIFAKSKDMPKDIPKSPKSTYRNKGWKGWGDFLGTRHKKSGWWSYEKSKKFLNSMNFKSRTEFIKSLRDGKIPNDIPANPAETYKNKGWKRWGDFLGTGNLSPTTIGQNFLPWSKAKPIYQRLARENGLKNGMDWKRFAKENKKLLEEFSIPQDPWRVYSKERILRSMKNG